MKWVISFGLVCAGLALFSVRLQSHNAPAVKRGVSPAPAARVLPEFTTRPAGGGQNGLAQELHALAQELQAAVGNEQHRQTVAKLRQLLAGANVHSAAAAVRDFLDSKTDAPSGLGFKVGAHGSLTEAPTLRTMLLDALGALDPTLAAEYARGILNQSTSPDEWAVALRNLARGDTGADGRALLEQKARELMENRAWQSNPSAGYLEAFDVAAYLGSTNLAPTLTELVRRQDNPAISHASYLALDRLVLEHPAEFLSLLSGDSQALQGRDLTRADFIARADVRDPAQRDIVEKYLLNPQLGGPELAHFAAVFPSANFNVSVNLLTPAPTTDASWLRARDNASLQAVQRWLGDPRFAALQPQLQKMRSRLDAFVQQENGR